MKAQAFFGGTKPKETGKGSKVAKEQTGTQKVRTPHIARKTMVKQANVSAVNVPHRKLPNNPLSFESRPITKSKPRGKEDNRTSWR